MWKWAKHMFVWCAAATTAAAAKPRNAAEWWAQPAVPIQAARAAHQGRTDAPVGARGAVRLEDCSFTSSAIVTTATLAVRVEISKVFCKPASQSVPQDQRRESCSVDF